MGGNGTTPGDAFRDFFYQVPPIRLREPLAEALGAFKNRDSVLEYRFIDLVKMAGHACPTIAGAFLSCQAALEALYPDAMPVRGEIGVTVFGAMDEGVNGVIGQAFSFITGAAPTSGFRGLGHRFKRKDLLVFRQQDSDQEAKCFEFHRTDQDQSVLVKFYPDRIPSDPEKSRRMSELMVKVIWEAATEQEREEFRGLWMGRVQDMLLGKKDIDRWLIVEKRRK